MPDYFEMYKKLFNAITTAVGILQEAQTLTEEMYISDAKRECTLTNVKKDSCSLEKKED